MGEKREKDSSKNVSLYAVERESFRMYQYYSSSGTVSSNSGTVAYWDMLRRSTGCVPVACFLLKTTLQQYSKEHPPYCLVESEKGC